MARIAREAQIFKRNSCQQRSPAPSATKWREGTAPMRSEPGVSDRGLTICVIMVFPKSQFPLSQFPLRRSCFR